MKRIEVSRWVIAIPVLLILLFLLFLSVSILLLGLRDYKAHVALVEADAVAYTNKKLSESIDDKVLAWKKLEQCGDQDGK